MACEQFISYLRPNELASRQLCSLFSIFVGPFNMLRNYRVKKTIKLYALFEKHKNCLKMSFKKLHNPKSHIYKKYNQQCKNL